MPLTALNVPEPERKVVPEENEVSNSPPPIQNAPLSSDEVDSDTEEFDHNGYQLLPLAEDLDISSEDEEVTNQDFHEETPREIVVNADLVRKSMKSISLNESNIPTWAKTMSDEDWNQYVKRAISTHSDNAIGQTSKEYESSNK